MKNIQEHKQRYIVIIICAILLILIGITFYQMLAFDDNLYGNRLDEAVEVDDAVMSKIKEELINTGNVNELSYRTNIKIIKFFIDTDVSSDKAKELSDIILTNLSEKAINFYDIEIYVTNSENDNFPMVGYHSKNGTQINWVLNKAVETNEE